MWLVNSRFRDTECPGTSCPDTWDNESRFRDIPGNPGRVATLPSVLMLSGIPLCAYTGCAVTKFFNSLLGAGVFPTPKGSKLTEARTVENLARKVQLLTPCQLEHWRPAQKNARAKAAAISRQVSPIQRGASQPTIAMCFCNSRVKLAEA
jgi:hypothetical protein